ncbi:aminodeoxychorismate synthase [Pseudomassariella vexata]|uniref:aminodeoxychorismate synthase n=1 Tax=Pseudomassariella vexata TaxID=1141098 RepID=A0A1Y2EJU5_9PEZI|nr:aminodeoxychorismate synthase [Pseudomassariella vexata]ORY71556.1 aminodeoxychorismate synthase [Pseudomassariella vexata]
MSHPRILFLDAYDSFSNNVVSLLNTLLDAEVHVLPIDSPQLDPKSPTFHDALVDELRRYDAVVCGPGPGSPDSEADVGLMKHIWQLEDEHLLPVLGICLGFQSLAVSCGATTKKLTTGLHGMIRQIDHRSDVADSSEGNIFTDIPSFRATLYHSLCADIGQGLISEADWPAWRWASPATLPQVLPLAWVEEPRDGFVERILMGMKHTSKPFWGFQYHPESICSDSSGHRVILNWFEQARRWSERAGRRTQPNRIEVMHDARNPSLLSQPKVDDWIRQNERDIDCRYTSRSLHLPAHVQVPDVVELLQSGKQDQIILDSASAHADRIGLDVRGRYSIIALDVEKAMRFEYHAGASQVVAYTPSSTEAECNTLETMRIHGHDTIWHVLARFLQPRRTKQCSAETPFMGGFMGYATYELGLECIDVETFTDRGHQRPDLCFAWITKSIVIDHLESTLRIQNLHSPGSDPGQWIDEVARTLQNSTLWADGLRVNVGNVGSTNFKKHLTPPMTPTGTLCSTKIQVPDADEYECKVRQCQDFIAAGDSYELCLTDQTSITRSTSAPESGPPDISSNSWGPSSATETPSSWQIYRSLRACQPAPFGSYIRLGGATLISSSPERFLEYNGDGLCSMRPMKGTVRKSDAVATLEQAERILHIPKEEAENLMIVDLVRHDLHSVCGPGHVIVPQLLKVEEYASVFQMISVVQGQLPVNDDADAVGDDQGYSGLDILAASLPPGSMTGAPKKRSCQILQQIEGRRERSLYSGVVGYMDIAGRGDWSVTIRSLFRWDDEIVHQHDGTEQEVWHIGAGGAVTALSTPEGERDEMMTKLKGPLAVFD